MEEAKRRYAEGHAKYLAGHYDEALAILVQSNALVPSPNSGLLIARCLLELHRPIEAYEKFAEVEQTALDLVRDGETRYAETAAAAAKEKNLLRAKLGALRLSARAARVTATIDGRPVTLSANGDAIAMHEPGEAKVVFKKDGIEDAHSVVAEAGKEIAVSFRPPPESSALPASTVSTPPPVVDERPSKPMPWYGYVTGGVAVVGLGAFVGFGVASETTYSDLQDRCAPRCRGADRDAADSGQTYQTIANIGLVVGVVAAIATGVIILTR